MGADMHIKHYWQTHGTRRPFPALYKAVELYGRDNVMYSAPRYEAPGQCPWCGGVVESKRRRFCSDDCRDQFNLRTVWQRGRDPYSLRMLYRDNFTCQDCGELHVFMNPFGMPVPIDDGQLEVHHILPVSQGGGDEPDNLVTLCKKCHQKRHRTMKEDNYNDD